MATSTTNATIPTVPNLPSSWTRCSKRANRPRRPPGPGSVATDCSSVTSQRPYGAPMTSRAQPPTDRTLCALCAVDEGVTA